MASRTTKSGSTISLFPFLCILICSLGVLIFIVVGICLVSFANPYISFGLKKGSNGHTETPVYVECRQDTLIIHPEKAIVPLARIAARYSEFMQLIKRIKSSRKRIARGKYKYDDYVMFLIYPDGTGSFRKAKYLVKQENIKFGFEPMDKNWRLSYK